MKVNKKKILIIIGVILLISVIGNIYYLNKVNNYKEKLEQSIRVNLQKFAGKGGNIEDESVYAEQYGSIVAAHQEYCMLSESNSIPSDEINSDLAMLLLQIKYIMINDKNKFSEVFKDEVIELMFDISEDFEDKEAISKVYGMLNK